MNFGSVNNLKFIAMYMFKRSSDGAMIYGDNPNSIFQGALWIKPTSGNNVELRNLDGTVFAHEIDITTVKKENESFYADIADFNAVSGTFFFRPGLTSSGLVSLPDESGLRARINFRDGVIKFDKELTVGGFSGTESTDDGVTGDWVCKYEFPF